MSYQPLNVSQGADGYLAFFTGVSGIAGDNDLFWDRVNNRLGIGTVTPDDLLQVKLDVDSPMGMSCYNTNTGNSASAYMAVGAASTGGGEFAFYGLSSGYNYTSYFGVVQGGRGIMQTGSQTSNGLWIGTFHASAPLILCTANAERLRILNDGKVGIGTTTPQNKLDVEGAVAIGATYSGTNTAPSDGLLVEGSSAIGYTSSTAKLSVNGGVSIGSNTVNVSNGLWVSGRIGIGADATSPATDLYISSTTASEIGASIRNDYVSASASVGAAFTVRALGQLAQFKAWGMAASGTMFGQNKARMVSLYTDATAGYADTTMLAIGTQTAIPIVFGTNNIEHMRLTSAGHLGIGTSASSAPYDLYIGSDVNGNIGMQVRNDSTGTGAASEIGVVSLGGASWFIAHGMSHGATRFGNPTARTTSLYVASGGWEPTTALTIGTESAIPIIFGTGNAERMQISGIGHVGIGTNSPHEKLTINGIISLQEQDNYDRTKDGYGSLWAKSDGKLYYTDDVGTAYDLTAAGGGGSSSGVAGAIQFSDGASGFSSDDANLHWDDTNNLFGIGTNTPQTILHVYNDSPELRVEDSGTSGTEITQFIDGVMVADWGADTSGMWLVSHPNNTGSILFQTQYGGEYIDQLLISNNGNVGIGNTAPDTKVHMSGNDNGGVALTLQGQGTDPCWADIEFINENGDYCGDIGVYMSSSKFYIGNYINNSGYIDFVTETGGVDYVRLRISNEGNIGIDTLFPIERLTVNGVIALQEQDATPATQDGYGKLYVKDDNKLYYLDGLGSEKDLTAAGGSGVTSAQGADGYLAFFTGPDAIAGDNDLFYDRVNGRLGIGTSAPVSPLHISGSRAGAIVGKIENVDATSTTSFATLALWAGTKTSNLYQFSESYTASTMGGIARTSATELDASDSLYLATQTANPIRFFINSTLAMTIDGTNRYVGIGTTGPDWMLDVETSDVAVAKFGTSLPVYICTPWPAIVFNAYWSGGWKFGAGSSNNYCAYITVDPSGGGVYIGASSTYGNAGGAATMPTVLMINKDGKVGIGTTTPQNRLDVEGAVAIGATYSGTNTAPSNGLLVEGSVGIGTSTPQNKLDIEGSVAIGATYSGTTEAPANGLIVEGVAGFGTNAPSASWQVSINRATEGQFLLNTVVGSGRIGYGSAGTWPNADFRTFINAMNGAHIIIIPGTPNGNVGIGYSITAPQNMLAVEGNISVGSAYGTVNVGSNNLAVVGNIGIGTPLPHEALTINGIISLQEQDNYDRIHDGYGSLWAKSDGKLYYTNDIGTEYDLSSSGGAPGGSDGQIQYNDGGSFGGAAQLYYDDVNDSIGIGTPTPQTLLHIYYDSPELRVEDSGTSGTEITQFIDGEMVADWGSDSSGMWLVSHPNNTGSILFQTQYNGNYLDQLLITNNGNVGIGSTAPDTKVHMSGNDSGGVALTLQGEGTSPCWADIEFINANSDYCGDVGINMNSGQFYFGNYIDNSGYFDFITITDGGDYSRLRITNDGHVGIGTTLPHESLTINGVISLEEQDNYDRTHDGYGSLWAKSDGKLYYTNDVGTEYDLTYGASDERIKKNIVPITGALDKINSIKGVTFDWMDNRDLGRRQMGVIAQDVEKVAPEAVYEDTIGIKNIKHHQLIGLLVEAIKELESENRALKLRFEVLESKLENK